MKDLRRLVLTTLTITPSGALSPGPLSASAAAVGALLGPWGGFLVALGHMAVELPYVAALHRFTGLLKGVIGRLKIPMNIVIIMFLWFFSYLLFKDAIAVLRGESSSPGGPIISGPLEAFAVGAALTGFNVYFLAWWLTVGYPIIEESSKLGLKGFAAMYISHVWMDYAWLIMLAVGGGATRVLGVLPYAILLAALATILAVFALKIAFDTAKQVIPGRAP
ncbi:MAG TPA: LysE family transporter [Thermoflexus sp.]|nr:LysE family transporter [Thermoflexus sp.]